MKRYSEAEKVQMQGLLLVCKLTCLSWGIPKDESRTTLIIKIISYGPNQPAKIWKKKRNAYFLPYRLHTV